MSTQVIAAVAAAVAAFFSAAAAVMILFEMRAARILSMRPEIHLLDWEFQPKTSDNPDRGRIIVKKIVNHGRGSARTIFFRLEAPKPSSTVQHRPFWLGSTIGLLAAGAESELRDGIGTFSWKTSMPSGGMTSDGENAKIVSLNLTCTYWDAIGNRYQAFFQLLAYNFEASNSIHMLTPGLHLFYRTEKRQAVWRLKLKQWYDGIKVVPPA